MPIVEMFEKKALSAKIIQKNISKHLTFRFGGCIFVMFSSSFLSVRFCSRAKDVWVIVCTFAPNLKIIKV